LLVVSPGVLLWLLPKSVVPQQLLTTQQSTAKPRSLRFTFSMTNTSEKPAEDIMAEIKRALT
jgi:hypothetical protein